MNKLSERVLRKWRKEALQLMTVGEKREYSFLLERILRLTQELLDNHLLVK